MCVRVSMLLRIVSLDQILCCVNTSVIIYQTLPVRTALSGKCELLLALLLMQAVDDCRASLRRASCMARASTPGRTAWSMRLVGSLSNFTYALFTAYIFWLMCFAFFFEE